MSLSIDRRTVLTLVASAALVACTSRDLPTDHLGTPPPGFTSAKADVNGTNLHYVRGGRGPAVILLHGMPEDWTEYRAIMPRLAERFTVVAVDLPGLGQSAPTAGGYDAASLAADIHALAQSLGFERPYVVGHDLGGMVTYAYVRRFPESLRGAMILDVPVPGIAGWEEAVNDLWHIRFIQAPGGIAEKLLLGRQARYIEHDLSTTTPKFTPAQRAYYTRIYGDPQMRAAFAIYRAFPQNAEFNAVQSGPNSVPLVVAPGEKAFGPFLETFVEGYRAKGMTRVAGVLIPGASHFVVVDNPEAVAELIERNADSRAAGGAGRDSSPATN
jgi:pimeloyl-ACP methyl ester carboxylesterase